MRDTERERQRHRQREKQAPSREPNVGLHPKTPESRPEPKADTQPLSHPGIPGLVILIVGGTLVCCRVLNSISGLYPIPKSWK